MFVKSLVRLRGIINSGGHMLVITRKPGEGVTIGDVRVQVVGVNGKNIRLGIEADKNTLILRDEINPCSQNKQPEATSPASMN
tara:strand:+ start:554 stop:802 length:249 start_codon:yes stop_codon:yes gene_type:complete